MSHRICILIFFVISVLSTPTMAGDEWQPYPVDLVQYHYEADTLHLHWQKLTNDLRGPLPTVESLRADVQRWPALYDHTKNHLAQSVHNHPLVARLSAETLDDQHQEYAHLLRQAWAHLFNGEFKQARDLGLALGPAGYFPGLYAQALYATLIETDPEHRRSLLEDVITKTDEILPMAPDHPMIRFGNVYGKARILEDLSATEAMATGYTSEITGVLQKLLEENPDNIYAIVLYAGVQAGIIEKAGSFIGRVTYGARKSNVEGLFLRAYDIAPDYLGLYYEHARSVLKLDEKSGIQQALEYLKTIATLGAVSAEDELVKHRAALLAGKLTR